LHVWCSGSLPAARRVAFSVTARAVQPSNSAWWQCRSSPFCSPSGQALETAVGDAARLILTGQAQGQNFNATAFKNAVCANVYGLFDCQNGIYVDVETFSSFSSITMPSPVDSQGNFQSSGFGYNPGGPGDVVVVRLFYQFPVYVSLLGFNLANVNGGKHLLTATAAFRNEPYAN
jgi:Flp pilus assembly protein TadG